METEEGFVLGVRRFGRVGLNWSLSSVTNGLEGGRKGSSFARLFRKTRLDSRSDRFVRGWAACRMGPA